ncbi:hypothetical protein [Paenibacillus polymyxa]|uniref:hypothetical protein n=1 Tax=Paenibacillus polymyxa TaxID=1406 RepID=UPI000F4D42D3|nr:hypothetical protein [Paenibacillus polymyxa]
MNKDKKKKKKLGLRTMLTSLAISAFWTTPIYADTKIKVGENLGQELKGNIDPVIPGIVLAVSAYFFIKRDWPKMFSFIGISLLLGFFSDWSSVKTLSTTIMHAIFGGN